MALGGGFNRWVQHTKDCASSGSVADETATALAALEALRERIPVLAQDIRLGFANVELAAWFQVLPGKPQIIRDVAHNPHAAAVLEPRHMGYFPYTYAIFGAMSDKDIQGIIRQ
jgi:dihydrofolate synthase/folylpolyglutamate synthase